MPESYTITWLDLLVAVIFLYFILRGVWTGLMRQLAALLALVGSYVITAQYLADLIPYTKRFIEDPKIVFLVTFLCLFFVSALMFSLAGRLLHRLMQISMLGWFNRLLGMVAGAIKAVLVASLLYMVLASTLSATNTALKSSVSTPYLRQSSEILRDLINDPELRDYFKEKIPALPLDLLHEQQKPKKETVEQPAAPSSEPRQARGAAPTGTAAEPSARPREPKAPLAAAKQ